MSVHENCKAAFPHSLGAFTTGMTLRDYFAAKALQAMLSAYPCQAIDDADGGKNADPDALAGDAYRFADSMLLARQS